MASGVFEIFPSNSLSFFKIYCFSKSHFAALKESLTSVRARPFRSNSLWENGGMSSARMTGEGDHNDQPLDNILHSRTLPGQLCTIMRSRASSVIVFSGSPSLAAKSLRNRSTKRGMSSLRHAGEEPAGESRSAGNINPDGSVLPPSPFPNPYSPPPEPGHPRGSSYCRRPAQTSSPAGYAKFCLGLEAHIGNFIQKNRPLMGEIEFPALFLCRPCKGTLLMAEELALNEIFRNGGAVDFDERFRRTPAETVERSGHQFFSRPVFPHDEDPGIGGSDDADRLLQIDNFGAATVNSYS